MILHTTSNGMPNQVEGQLDDGRPFYFRARHGGWSLAIGQPGETVDDISLRPDEDCDAVGRMSTAGWWNPEAAERFVRALLDLVD